MPKDDTTPAQTGDLQNDDKTQTPIPDETTANSTSSDNGEYEALVKELEEAKTKLTELTQISQQALADLQNYKKRSEEEKTKFVTFANASLITNMLPILDNVERAIANVPTDSSKEWNDGIVAIFKQMQEILKTHGLESIITTDQNFDPNLHEAVMTEEGPADKIIRELEKGYKIGDRVIRRSRVVVGTAPVAQENPPTPAPATSTPQKDVDTPETNAPQENKTDSNTPYNPNEPYV